MISAFGVEHGVVAKAESVKRKVDEFVDDNGKMSDKAAAAVPGSTVDVYNNSRKHKKESALGNWAMKLGGGAAGGALGYAAFRGSKGKIKMLNAKKLKGKRKKRISPEDRSNLLASTATVLGSTGGGYAGSRLHQEYVKRNPRYDYKEK